MLHGKSVEEKNHHSGALVINKLSQWLDAFGFPQGSGNLFLVSTD